MLRWSGNDCHARAAALDDDAPARQGLTMPDMTSRAIKEPAGAAPWAPAELLQSDGTTITCFEHQVPPSVAKELDQLYQHLHSSLLHYGVRRKAQQASTYIVRKEGKARVILLFTRSDATIHVVNEMIDIEPEEIQRFAAFIFAKFASVDVISFSLIGKEVGALHYPHHQYDGSEDIVLTLPATPDAYLASMSPKMRRNIRYCLRMIARDNPSFRCETTFGDQINVQHVHDLIALKKSNIGAKNLKFGISDEEIAWMTTDAKPFAQVTVVIIDGKVCGGAINLRVEDNFFGQIICYDPAYKKYSLGILCTYLTICDQISMGGVESHLCWGRYGYKYKLLGVQRDRASLDIYRSRTAYWRRAGVILARTVKTGVQDAKKRLLDMEREEGKIASAGASVVRILRKIKRSRSVT